MNVYQDTLINTRGDSLPGYRVQVVDSGGSVVTIYADDGGTRFTDASGNNVNYATADDTGEVAFYWTAATGQVLQMLDMTGALVKARANFADNMVLSNLPGNIAQSAVTDLVSDIAARPTSATLAATGGSALVGNDDGASGALWTTISGFITYLRSSVGASAVGFLQSGTGAVARTVQAKARDIVSVKDFGALGDGSTDDTDAIQAAIDYAETVVGDSGAEVVFPAGDYVHGALLVSVSGIRLRGDGQARLLRNTTTGNGLEFKAPNYPADTNARIYRCGFSGFMLGNYGAAATSGAHIYWQNVQDGTFEGNKFLPFPYAPYTAFRFDRCVNLTYSDNRGSSAAGTGVIFQECSGLFGNSNSSSTNAGSGFEFDSCGGNYMKTIQAYGNTAFGVLIRATISSSNISDQAAYFLIESWDMDTNGDHNWSINDLHESTFTACWGSSNSGSTVNKVGMLFNGDCSDIDVIGAKCIANNGPGIQVATTGVNINILGGTFASNGKQSGSANRVGILHQGSGSIRGVTAKNITRYGTTQQYGLQVVLGTATNPMAVEGNFLDGNAAGPIVPITATNYTNFSERNNSTGVSNAVASATTVTTPTLGDHFSITGTTDIYDLAPKWVGRRVALTFASTARIVGGSGMRLTDPTVTPGAYGTALLLYTGTEWVTLSHSINDNA